MKIKHVRKISKDKEQAYLDLMNKFDYVLFERYDLGDFDEIRVIRYYDKPYHKQLAKLEREYFSYEKSPLIPLIICSAAIIGLVTAFLVICLTSKQFDYGFWFLCLLLPALAFILLEAFIFIKAFYINIKNADKYKARQLNIIKETDELRKNYHESKNN